MRLPWVSLNFSLIERLIAFSAGPESGVVTATNVLSWDVKDINNDLVWGILGQNPSTIRILSRPNNGFLGETCEPRIIASVCRTVVVAQGRLNAAHRTKTPSRSPEIAGLPERHGAVRAPLLG